ncbi:hypothetical protein ABIE58_003403 [Roseovarius sp. MBR-78]|jgi:hypothetical protein|uniref:relaxase/mobilization nuclease domain-containing protein n=1 Tax=Roseovarius sp. MBR-78 TaxID=3156460 RepID=UPI00339810C5
MRFKVPKRQPESFKASSLYLAGQVKGLSPDRVEFVEGHNLYTTDPRAAAAVMDATAAQNHRCKTPAYHFIITFDPKDAEAGKVTQEVKRDLARKVLDDMGLSEHQALVYSHQDTDHPHLHFLVNRIHPSRHKAYNRHRDGTRLAGIVQERARELGLNVLRNREYVREKGLEADLGPEPSDAEFWKAKREDRAAQRPFDKDAVRALRDHLKPDFHEAGSWEELTQRLNAKGITMERKGQGLVLTDGDRFAKLSDMGKGVRFHTLEDRFGEEYDAFLIRRAAELKRDRTKGADATDADELSPEEKRTLDGMRESEPLHENAINALDAADMDYRYWAEVEAAYRQAENRITYARRQESYYRDREKTDTEWFQRRTVSLLRILDKVYGDPYAAKSAWDVLEKKHGVAEAEKLVRDNPHVLGKVRGLRIGDKRDAARAEAKRMSQYLGERRRKWRESRNRLEHTRSQIERARQRTRVAVRDFEMLQHAAGSRQDLKRIMLQKVKLRALALSRVSEKAIRQSRLSDARKEQLDKAYRRMKERQRARSRERERGDAFGLDLDMFD